MGTFGYLSRAHLATSDNIQLSQLQIQPLQDQIDLEQRKLKNAQTSLDALDNLVVAADPKDSNFIRHKQERERKVLNDEIYQSAGQIESLNVKLLPYKAASQKGQAEVGPLKYIAEMVYGKSASDHFDEAVRFVIIFIVIVFDPLAIVLLLAGTSGIKPIQQKEPLTIKQKRGRPRKDGTVSISENSILRFL